MKKSPEIISGRMTFGKYWELLVSKLTAEHRFHTSRSNVLLTAYELVIEAVIDTKYLAI